MIEELKLTDGMVKLLKAAAKRDRMTVTHGYALRSADALERRGLMKRLKSGEYKILAAGKKAVGA